MNVYQAPMIQKDVLSSIKKLNTGTWKIEVVTDTEGKSRLDENEQKLIYLQMDEEDRDDLFLFKETVS
jgi:hypothetical protein